MAGIYIHIPFCKQACHYCDFHFSTSLKKKGELIDAICDELSLRKRELNRRIETIYFGGGTPSLLTSEELSKIFDSIYNAYDISGDPEITLEANPDDLSEEKIKELADSRINRLSIGIQSFFESDLKLMNRAHNVVEAHESILLAEKYFDNYSIDLIYGIPELSNQRWTENLNKAIDLDVPHLSCYALTVEPKTALKKFIEKGIIPPVEDEVAMEHHRILLERTEAAGYENYEFSNFGKPSYFSKNNMAYWQGKPYLGIGPSAHSYSGKERSWNVANNSKYIQTIQQKKLPIEREVLTIKDRYNEYVMTRLRTSNGIILKEITELFGDFYLSYLLKQAQSHLVAHRLYRDDEVLKVTKKGKFLSDGIASDLFLLNLEDRSIA
ncbi:MAG: radical SAM family heme chaperone HemW [Flavobacteriaceae bacterium]|nr:radical SAM family heme chaperone HemW [Flavobacteriaceae bacterium]